MAKKSNKKKGGAKEATGAPKIIESKGGLSASDLTKEVLLTMEDDLRISNKQAKDFIESLIAVTEREIGNGKPVNLFHIAKVVPRLHTKGQREVFKEFGNPESGKAVKKYPAKVTIAVKRGAKIGGKAGKELLPTVQKMQKAVGA